MQNWNIASFKPEVHRKAPSDSRRRADIKVNYDDPELTHLQKQSMGRRGNPNWGKPVPFGPVVPTVTSFEEAVKELELQPNQYLHSTRLREWALRNKNSKFIPESLLKAWGLETDQF